MLVGISGEDCLPTLSIENITTYDVLLRRSPTCTSVGTYMLGSLDGGGGMGFVERNSDGRHTPLFPRFF